ncbi:uncharacterized protein LOC108908005 [Anoplophora glabripennis]|uniref:uncharacterized protein LOC108908005 n=1 Tax=Anoplophora glabripennis TaxID=217634 RepID=UPI0008746055|nr:uncharacterized protein LOC108908005 [Anoplophora glabripennis]
MYKLLCSNITKSHRSLTNFTGYYRKVAQKCNRGASSSKKFLSETDLQNKQGVEEGADSVECSEEALETEIKSDKKTKSYSSFFTQNISITPLSRPEVSAEQLIATTAAPSRFFHSSTVDNKCSTAAFKKPFKNKEAEKYYQLAVEQCMEIRSKFDKLHQQSNFMIRPAGLNFEVQNEFEHIDTKNNKNKPKQKPLKKIHKEKLMKIPELEKIAEMKTAKPRSQFKQSKIRITYPTHIASYKVGTNGFKMQHTLKQQVAKNNQVKTVYRDPVPEPLQLKVKHETSTEKDKAEAQKLRNKTYQRRLQRKCNDDNSEYAKQQLKYNKSMMQQHPTVRKANSSVRMAFKNRYNKLLQKSGLLYQAPTKTKEEDKDQAENHDAKRPTSPKPAPTYRDAEEVLFRRTEMQEPQVTEHPIATAKQAKVESSLKYPKRILSEKSENYDIDATCIKNSNRSNVTTTYGDFIAESEEKVKHFVETHKQEAKELEDHKDSKGSLKTIEKIPSSDGFGEYLRKLKELRDQTAVERLNIKKVEMPKQDMTKADSKKIKEVVTKLEDQIDKTPKDESENVVEVKAEVKSDIIIDKDKGKIKQYPISDKFVVKKDEDSLIRKAVNVIRDTVIRRTRPKKAKVRSQSVEHLRQEKSSVTQSIPLKKVRSENLIKKVPSKSAKPKTDTPQPIIRSAPLKTNRNENLSKKIKSKLPTPSSNKSQEKYKFTRQEVSKETSKAGTNPLKKIMDQYRVPCKTEFKISMAELKRINRRKRREREKQLLEEVKLQHRKLEEAREAVVKEKEAIRDHKYKLDSKISESKSKEDLAIADEELLQQKEEIALKELEKDVLNMQENPELFAGKAQEEREAHDTKTYSEEDGPILKEKEVQEQVSCSTTEIKDVNNLQNPEQNVEKTAVLEENLENVSDKRINQQNKLLAEENLAKLKEYPEKNKDMIAEERGQRLKTRVANKIIEKKAKLEQNVPNANYIGPKKYLEKASDKKQPLYKNNQEINKKAQGPTKIEFQYMKSQNKLKTKKAKVKTQVLGKRKNLLTSEEASEKLTDTTLKNKENHLLTDVEKPYSKRLKEIEIQQIKGSTEDHKAIAGKPACNILKENAQKKNFQKVAKKVTEQRQSSAEDLKIISKQIENALLAEKRMEVSQKDADKDNSITTEEKLEIYPDTSEEVKEKYILDTKSKSVIHVQKEPAKENLENTPEKLSEENNKKDSSTELEKSSTPLKEKALQMLKEIARKTGSEEIEEKKNQQTKKSLENDSNTLQEVKGKYLLEANLNKTDRSILRETVKENIKTANTGSEITRSTKEAAVKGNSEKREETEQHKLEKGSEKPTDIVQDVKEKYLLEANLKKVVNNILQEETLKENLDRMPEKSPAKSNLNELKVSKEIDSMTSKEKDMHMLKLEQEENLRESLEKHSNIAPDIKGKYMLENSLKKSTDDVLEEQSQKENVSNPSSLEDNLVKSDNTSKQNFSPTLEVKDKEEQTLKKDAEKCGSTVSEEEKKETAEERAKINISNVLEEIRKHIPHINIKNLLEEQTPKKEKNVSDSKDSPQQKEYIVEDREKICKKTEAKDVQKLERDLEKYSPETRAKTTLNEQPSYNEKSLLDNSMQEKMAESSAPLFVTRNKLEGKQPDAKPPIKENSMVNKINEFQQGNLMKPKEASTRLVKLVKNIDLMKPTQKVEEKIEKSTVPENRPTIRREQPPKPTDKHKKEKPKSKTDIVLPPKGRNDPKMQHTTRNATLDDPRRNFIEEINEALSKITHSSLRREETKKCKSLADLAEEQKAKILKEIEVTWNKENDKTRDKNEASKDELEVSSKEQEELGTANLNKLKNVRECYESIIDMQEKRKLNVDNATFCLSVTKSRDGIKNNSTWNEEHPRLIVKLRYKGENEYEKPNDMSTNCRSEYAMGKSASCFTTPQKTSKDGTSTEPQIPNFTVLKGNSDMPQFDNGEGLSALHFRRTKKARIEDDFLKIQPRVLNVGYTPKEDSWHSQNDLDFNFTKLKKARIEDDHIMYEIKDVKESPEQTHNENDVEEAKADIVNERWCSNGDTAFCFQKQQRKKIEDDTRVKEILSGKGEYDSIKKISSQSTILDQSSSIGKEEIVRKVEAKFEDLEDEINRSVKEEPLKNLSKTERSKNDTKTATEKSDIKHKVEASGSKIPVKEDSQIKTNIEKLINVMKKADKELEEVLKVYEILKLPQTQYRTLVKPADYNNTKQDNVEMKEECLKFKENIALLAGKQSKNINKKQDKTETKETNLKLKENTELVATKKTENYNSVKHDKAETKERCLKLKEGTEAVAVKKNENYNSVKHDKVESREKCLKLKESTELVAVKKAENYKGAKPDKVETTERCLKLNEGTEAVAVKKNENYNSAKHDKAETKERCLQLKEGTEAAETKERCLKLKEGTEAVAVKKNENYNSAKHDKAETKEKCLKLKENTELIAGKKVENYNSIKQDKAETKEKSLKLKDSTELVADKKTENYSSTKQDKEKCLKLKENTKLVAVRKAKSTAKDSKTYMVSASGEKCSNKDNMGIRNETEKEGRDKVPKKLSTPQSEKKECKLNEKSTKTTVKPHKYLLMAGIQKQAKRQLRGSSEEAKGNNNKTTTGCAQRQPKRAKICHKDEKKTDSTTKTGKQECNEKDILKQCKKSSGKKNLLCPPVKIKSAKLDCSKYEDKKEIKEPALDKNGSPQNSGGETSKEYSDSKLIVQMFTNDGKETLGNKIVVTCNNCLPGESLNERDKTEERREKQEKPVEIPGKRKTKVRAQPMHGTNIRQQESKNILVTNTVDESRSKAVIQISNDLEHTNFAEQLCKSKLKIITLARNVRENIFQTKYMLDKQIEVLETIALPHLGASTVTTDCTNTILEDKCDTVEEKEKEIVNRDPSGEVLYSKGEKVVTLFEKKLMDVSKTLLQGKSAHDLENEEFKGFSGQTENMEESNGCTSKGNLKSNSGDCKKSYSDQNQIKHVKFENSLMKLEGKEQQQDSKERVVNHTEEKLFKFSNNYLDYAYKKVRHILSIVNDENIYLAEENSGANKEIQKLGKINKDGKLPEEKSESKSLVELKQDEILEKNKEGNKLLGIEYCEYQNTKIDSKKLESEIEKCCLNWKYNTMETNIKHNLEQKLHMKKLGKVSQEIGQQGGDENVQTKTEPTENQNTEENELEKKSEQNFTDKKLLKTQNSTTEVGIKPNSMLIALENKSTNVTSSMKNPGSNQLQSFASLCNLEENSSKSNRLTSITEPCLKYFSFNILHNDTKPEEKSKYKYTSQRIRQHLIRKNNYIENKDGKLPEQRSESKSLVELKQDEILEKNNKEGNKLLGIGYCKYQNTKIDSKKLESEIEKCCLNWKYNTMETNIKHNLEQKLHMKKLGKVSQEIGLLQHGNEVFAKERGDENVQTKTEPTENQNTEENEVEKKSEQYFTDKKLLKTQNSTTEVGIKPNSMLIALENKSTNVTSSMKNPGSNQLQSFASLCNLEENSSKSNRLTSITEPCLKHFSFNDIKPEEKSKYKYTCQRIRQHLTRKDNYIEINKTKESEKRPWHGKDRSLYKKQKTGIEVIGNRYKPQQKNEYTYTSQKIKQSLMRKEENNIKNNTMNVNKKRIRDIHDESVSRTSSHLKKRQKTVPKITEKRYVIQDYSELGARRKKIFANINEISHKTGSKLEVTKEKRKVEKQEQERKVNEDRNENISQISGILLEVSPENTDMKCQSEIQTASESCKQKRDLDEESSNSGSKELLPQCFVKSREDIQKTVMGSLSFSEKLMRKLSPNKMDYDPTKGPMKARIEQIFKKHYKEEETIYRFNKNLIRHLQQLCEKTPLVFQKPRVTEINEMQKTLYKFLATEMKKPISESPVGFSLFKKCNKWEGIVYYSKDKQKRLPNDSSEKEPKAVSKRSVTFFIEKAPRDRYKKESSEVPLKPVTRSCERLCMPLKAISQVALKPSVEEMTTLNKYHIGKTNAISTIIPNILDKYKGLKITYINIKRPMRKSEEGFLPTILTMRDKNELKALEKANDPDTIKRQILEFRYELLRKLHREFSALYEKDVNKNIGKFEIVSKYYKSVKANLKNKLKDEVVTKLQSKSMDELLGPSSKPSFERVSRYYNIIMDKNKERDGEGTSQEVWNNANTLVQKLSEETTEIDKSRNDCKGVEHILTKSKKKENNDEKDPEDPKKQN